MRTYERNGINVDQCTECRGLFLDRGELEHLVQAEGSFYGGSGSAPRSPEPQTYHHHGREYRKRKKNFLEELFD
jgi:Zn-finger nucleic acid-binding protein